MFYFELQLHKNLHKLRLNYKYQRLSRKIPQLPIIKTEFNVKYTCVTHKKCLFYYTVKPPSIASTRILAICFGLMKTEGGVRTQINLKMFPIMRQLR